MTTSPTGILTWSTAASWSDLAELTARWLEGIEPEVPSYGGAPETETACIAAPLAAINRLGGLITYNSQPGEIDADGRQRASVDALALDAETARRIESLLRPTELIADVRKPGRGTWGWVPITLDSDGTVYTSGLGAPASSEIAEWFREVGVSRGLAAQVRRAYRISIIDPMWGRNDLLWTSLLRAAQGLALENGH